MVKFIVTITNRDSRSCPSFVHDAAKPERQKEHIIVELKPSHPTNTPAVRHTVQEHNKLFIPTSMHNQQHQILRIHVNKTEHLNPIQQSPAQTKNNDHRAVRNMFETWFTRSFSFASGRMQIMTLVDLEFIVQ